VRCFLIETTTSKNQNNIKNRQGRKPRRGMSKSKDITNLNEIQVLNDRPIRKLNEHAPLRWKNFSTSAIISLGTAGNGTDLAGLIGQGFTAFNRVGDVANFKRMDIRLNMQPGDTTNIIRMIVLSASGNPPAFGLGSFLANGVTGSPDVTSFVRPYIKELGYHVLCDRTWSVCQNSSTGNVVADFSIPINQQVTYVQSTSASLAGALTLYFISDSSIAPNPQVNVNYRLWFTD
jgi:hypothetical protein